MKCSVIYLNAATAALLLSHTTTVNAASTDEIAELETVSVNARLWKEDLSKSPVSAVIIKPHNGDANLDISALQSATSGISLEQSSVQTRVVVRGVSGLNGGLQDPVGYFINDVALPLGGNQLPALFDLESIELVKGPQGTLYGKNTEAGAVKINSADPSWDFSGNVSASVGSIDGANSDALTKTLSGRVSNTLVKNKLAGSIAFKANQSQGAYLNKNDNNDSGGEIENGTLSTGLNYIVGDNTDIVLKSVYDKNDTNRNRFRFSDGINETKRFTTNTDINGYDNDRLNLHSFKLNHSFDTLQLTAVTGFTDYKRHFEIDLDATIAPLPATQLSLENKSLSQEVRLSSANNSNTKWLAGAYLYKEASDIDFTISPLFQTTKRSTTLDQHGKALFGQVEQTLNPQWKIAVGGRYEDIKQQGEQSFSSMSLDKQYSADVDSSEFLPKASLSYQSNPNSLFYLSYSEGYLPGGYNYNSASDVDSFTFKPEHSELIELGWKKNINKKVNTQITVFHNTVKDKQIVDLLPGFTQSINNAGETKSYGAELSVNFPLGSTLKAFTNVGIQRSEASTYTTTTLGNVQDLSGNDLTFSPEYTYSAGLAYGGDKKGWFGQLAIRGSDEYFFNSQNTLKQPSYTVADTEIGYRFKDLSLSLWAKNMTDEAVISRAISTQSGTVVEDMWARTVGLTLKANF